jgi:hypothetical protein
MTFENNTMESLFVCNMNALSEVQKQRYKEITVKLNEERQVIHE